MSYDSWHENPWWLNPLLCNTTFHPHHQFVIPSYPLLTAWSLRPMILSIMPFSWACRYHRSTWSPGDSFHLGILGSTLLWVFGWSRVSGKSFTHNHDFYWGLRNPFELPNTIKLPTRWINKCTKGRIQIIYHSVQPGSVRKGVTPRAVVIRSMISFFRLLDVMRVVEIDLACCWEIGTPQVFAIRQTLGVSNRLRSKRSSLASMIKENK